MNNKAEDQPRTCLVRSVFTLLMLVFLSLLPTRIDGQVAVDTLQPGTSVERNLTKDQTHTYRIKLDANQCLEAVLTQKEMDLAIRIYGKEDRPLAESAGQTRGERRIFFVPAVAGDYRLQIRPTAGNADKGSYVIKVFELRQATEEDRTHFAAQELFAEAVRLGSYENATTQTRQIMIEKYQSALEAWTRIGDRKGQTDALFAIGEVNHYLDRRRSLESLSQALTVARSAGDRWSEELILESLGETFAALGDSDRGLDAFTQSLAISRELDDHETERLDLYAIALTYMDLGEAQSALDYNNQLLKLTAADKNRTLILHSLCKNYLLLGEAQNALDYCRQASSLWQTAGKRPFEAAALSYIGSAYSLFDDRSKEREYYNEALKIFREVEDRNGEASMLKNIGVIDLSAGNYPEALENFKQARTLAESISSPQYVAIALRLTGQAYWALGNNQKALEYFNQSLSQFRSVRDRSNEAATLLGIARSERDLGQLDEARSEIEAALEIVESLGAKVTSLDLRASYLSTKHEYYEFYVDLLMRMAARQPNAGYIALAFQTSERARARSLVESLAEARVDVHQGTATDLITRERAIKQQINFRTNRLTQLLGGKHSAEEVATAQQEIENLLESYRSVAAEIRIKNPKYSSLSQPQALSLQDVQKKLLDQNTVLLEYSLGEVRSFVWLITPDSITSYELPSRSVIEAASRRMYELLTARSKSVPKESAEQKLLRVARADQEYPHAAAELSQMLLGPFASALGSKRLLLVTEGALQYVPFGALPIVEGDKRTSSVVPGYKPLIVDHEIVTLPSASVLSALRNDVSGRQVATKTLAVLADPVFRADDSRIPNTRGRANRTDQVQSLPADVLRSAEESGLTDFARLRFSRAEADGITQLAPESGRLEAVDFSANRATALSPELSQYRMVHFATHGLINSRHPELSGIVLSLVDQKGQPQDGFLRLFEIYSLKLNADLVVLSACQTALGREVKGEGLIGLTRGFMYAGAPRVVASLWRIDDRATAELMTRFYRAMLSEKLTPAAALRAAQVSMLQEKRWSAPHYWAAFTIQGEWK